MTQHLSDRRSSSNHAVAPAVRQLLGQVRALLQRYILVQAALMMLGCCLAVYWLGGLIDYLPVTLGSNETPRWLRVGMLLAMVAGCLWSWLFWALPRWATRIHNRSLALLIERHYPHLDNYLVTVVELDSADDDVDEMVSNPAAHRQMVARTHQSLSQRLDTVDATDLFNWQPLWGVGTAVVMGLVLTLVAAVGMPSRMQLWTQRLFALSDEPWPRQAELRADGIQLQAPTFTGQLAAARRVVPFVEGVARVPSGAAVMLQVSAEAERKLVPELCTLFYASSDGNRGRANLRRIGKPLEGWQPFALDGPPLDGMTSDMTLDVVGLDARLRDLQLLTVEPAVVATMTLECQYPQYLLDSLGVPPQEAIPYRAGVKIPQGTQVTLVGQASNQLQQVDYLVMSALSSSNSTDPSTQDISLPKIESMSASGEQFRIPLGRLESNQTVEIRLIDEHGLFSERVLRYVVTVLEDAVPEVASQLEGIGSAITPQAVLPIRGTVTDDNKVRLVEADLVGTNDQSVKIRLQLTDSSELKSDVDLQQLAERGQFEVAAGDTIGLRVRAQDYYDLDEELHEGRGQPQQLAVVTPDQLLVILDRKELEMRQRLELIISELQQMREVLQTLGTAIEESATPATPSAAAESPADAVRRRRLFRAQQSVLQGDKSEQELTGVAARVDDIRLQLVNNRIDSYDRQTRLQEKVHQPLSELLGNEYPRLSAALLELQAAAQSDSSRPEANASIPTAKTAVVALDVVLVKLLDIKESMLDIESFNEIIELVRNLLDDEEALLKRTEQAQKEKILQLLQ